jgi:hypothetical protein
MLMVGMSILLTMTRSKINLDYQIVNHNMALVFKTMMATMQYKIPSAKKAVTMADGKQKMTQGELVLEAEIQMKVAGVTTLTRQKD